MNNITIELCAEDRARIDNLTKELAALRQTLTSDQVIAIQPEPQEAETPEQPLPPAETPKAEAPKPAPKAAKKAASEPAETPKAEAPKPAPKAAKKAASEPAPAAREVTVAELQAKVVELVNAGKKEETRGIISKYSPNVSGIPEDKRAEVLELLNGLEG